MRERTVVVAGGTGALGSRVASRVVAHGCRVRLLSRRVAPALVPAGVEWVTCDVLQSTQLAAVVCGADAVFSALGASLALRLGAGRAGYEAVDTVANRRLIAAVQASGGSRFLYIAAFSPPGMRATAYLRAHDAVVDALAKSTLEWCSLRPTGCFSAFAPLLHLARRGLVPVFGDGTARTNPISDDDVADLAVARLLESAAYREHEIPCGGPDVLTRREIALLVCACAGRGRPVHGPAWIGRALATCVRPLSPRLSDLVRFVLAASTHDAIAPVHGARRLVDALATPPA